MASTKSKQPGKVKRSKATPELEARPRAPVLVELPPRSPALPPEVLDQVLALQLLVAWAGEGKTDPPRLGWWRTSLVDEFGGEDLFKRLMPRTWRWAVLEAARVAARSVDAAARSHAADGDLLLTLFHFGFSIDEQLDDRLAERKRSTEDPAEALPDLALTRQAWDREQFAGWLSALAPVSVAPSSVGLRLKAELPADHVASARMLAAAMAPVSERYPAPHFKVER
jgi:hypothetical protein